VRIYGGVAQEITAAARAAMNLAEPATVLHSGDSLGDRARQPFAVAVDDLLVARARKGDVAALETLYRSFERPVYTLARRLTRTPHDAEDVLQETFLEVVRSIRQFRGEGSLAGWIRRVAASKALMRLRQEGARPPEQELSDELADSIAARHPGAGPAAAVERMDLETAVARLSDSARAVLWLHDVEGYSHEEIGAMAGKTPSFSKSQLARAHARLRVLLAPGAGEGPCT
jgi:RNA polymerase sigma factor (sigma-70 family)